MPLYLMRPIGLVPDAVAPREFVCDDDRQALGLASTMAQAGLTVEVWEETRGYIGVRTTSLKTREASSAEAGAPPAEPSAIPGRRPAAWTALDHLGEVAHGRRDSAKAMVNDVVEATEGLAAVFPLAVDRVSPDMCHAARAAEDTRLQADPSPFHGDATARPPGR